MRTGAENRFRVGRSLSRRSIPRLRLGLSRDATYLFWGISVFSFGAGLYAYLFTIYLEDLGATAVQIGLLVGVQGLVRISMNLPGGILSERISRRKMIIGTTAIAVPAAFIFGLAHEWWQAAPGMILLVIAVIGNAGLSSYLAEAGGRNRARTFTMVYVVGPSVALALSPATGGWLADATSYRVVFFASGLFFLLATLIFFRLSERPPIRHAGSAASYQEALAVPVVRAIGVLQFSTLIVLMIGTTLMTNYLKEVRHISVGTIGWFGSLAAVGSATISIVVTRVKWITTMRTIGTAPIFVGLLCGVILLTGNPLILGLAFLGRGGFMVAWSLFAAVLSDTTPQRLQSRAFAIAEFLGAIGLALAPFAAGALYDWHRGAPLLITCLTTPLLTGLAFWIEHRYVRPAIAARTSEAAYIAEVEHPVLAGAVAEGAA